MMERVAAIAGVMGRGLPAVADERRVAPAVA